MPYFLRISDYAEVEIHPKKKVANTCTGIASLTANFQNNISTQEETTLKLEKEKAKWDVHSIKLSINNFKIPPGDSISCYYLNTWFLVK